jgi:nucleoside-diphosphate-sugar epimerase
MKKILVTGALGQIGSELVMYLRNIYGSDNVVATDIKIMEGNPAVDSGPYELLDVQNANAIAEIAKKYNIDAIIHLASLLSAVAEEKPVTAWKINMGGLFNTLEVARELECSFFTPSSIGAFGPSTPKIKTLQDTIQRPQTMYGVTKVSGELLCDYYHKKFGVDTRGVRFPGLISYVTPPGGGTTDYAVDIYYGALIYKRYSCFIKEGTFMDMMYMQDALNAVVTLMEADSEKLVHRNAFNIAAMSFEPSQIAAEIKKHIPDFQMEYDVDPVRQAIADSWPDSIDDSAAKTEWGYNSIFDISSMTEDMIEKLSKKENIQWQPQ